MAKYTLFCFKLNEDNGVVTCNVIDNARRVTISEYTGRYEYRWYITRSQWNHVRSENIDKVIHLTIYSFNPSREHAVELFKEYLADKYNAAIASSERWDKLSDRLKLSEIVYNSLQN